jgi:TIR domain
MIYEALASKLSRDNVFMDVDSIPLGADFVEILEGWVNECEILLALIGKDWIAARDPTTKRRRLDNANDFVRIEIRRALERGIPVVPILLDRAPMPAVDKLPEDIQKLVRRQAEFVEHRTFKTDVARLIAKLGLKRPRG